MRSDERGRTAAERDRTADERDRTADEWDRTADERDRVATERDRVADECDQLLTERSRMADARDGVATERDAVADERERVLTDLAVQWDERLLALVAEVDGLSTALSSRGVIEQAKGVIMHSMRCGDEAAFAVLVAQSQNENRKLREVAAAIVAMQASVPPSSA